MFRPWGAREREDRAAGGNGGGRGEGQARKIGGRTCHAGGRRESGVSYGGQYSVLSKF